MAKWVVTTKGGDFQKIAKEFHISPILARIMRNRGIETAEEIKDYLYGSLENLSLGEKLKDGVKAGDILLNKIKEKKRIRIIGDYDIDGVCASYILWKGLLTCGAAVDTAIPDRMKDGYGINERLIEKAAKEGIDTIVTCDNGIAAREAVLRAKELGLTVIVTDHHEIPYEQTEEGEKQYILPKADAIVNPKQPDCPYPFKNLCGAALACQWIQTVMKRGGFYQEDCVKELLSFAAFATIGDVMELFGENRILVKYGMEEMRQTKNLGLKALMDVNEIKMENLSPYHIGFVLGPCMNAAGRLDTARAALMLLQAESEKEARQLAENLKEYNEERKSLTQEFLEKAHQYIEEKNLIKDKVLVIYLKDCHESIAGIIAGRIREAYYKPVFVLTKGEEGVKGSGRSIDAFHMYEEMTKCKELFTKFGGHKMAAGLSLTESSVPAFQKKINEQCQLKEEDFVEKVVIDMRLPFSYITEDFVEELKILEPFGMGNTKPVFAEKEVKIISGKIVGKKQKVLKMLLEDSQGIRMEGIYFGDGEKLQQEIERIFGKEEAEAMFLGKVNGIKCMITYYPSINEFMGRRSLQLVVQHYAFPTV